MTTPPKLSQFLLTLVQVLISRIFWIAFLIAAIISLTIYTLIQNEEQLKLEAAFLEKIEGTHSNLLMRMNQYKALLYAARSIYSALPSEKKSDWATLTQSLNLHGENLPQADFFYIENVPLEHLFSFQNQHPSLKIHPAIQDNNCIVTMSSLSKSNPEALGYNLCTNETQEKAIFDATETGKIKASPLEHLFGKMGEEATVTLYIPTFENEVLARGVKDKKSQVTGWIGTPIQFEALFQKIISEENGLEFQLYQGEATPSNLLFNHIKGTTVSPSLDLFSVRTLTIDDEFYTIVYRHRNINASISNFIPFILLSALFSLSYGCLIWSLYTNKERAEALASKMSESLTHTRDAMKKLLDSSPGGIYNHTDEEDWKATFVSDYFARLTGYPAGDFKTREDFDQIIHPHDLESARKEMLESLKENEAYEVEYRIIKSDHRVIWVMDKGYLEKHEVKSFVRGIIFDITKTKRIEKASLQLNNALMHLAEGISLVDCKGTFIEVNPVFSKVWGWEMDQLPGVQFMTMIHPEDIQEAEKLFNDLASHEKVSADLRGVRQDGSYFYISLILVGLYNEGNELMGAYLFARDISDRKKSEDKLRKAKEEISMAYKTKSEFLASMSHEMRSPLNVIIGYSDMLREELRKELPALVDDISAIKRAGSHLLNLVDDIIDISKLETGQSEMQAHIFDIHDVVENVVSAASSLVTVNHNKLDIVFGANLGLMNSDFSKIRQILLNLINNAAKFTNKGHIELSIKASGDHHEWIHFTVIDAGCGISQEKLKKIFTPFATKKSDDSKNKLGTGLGLPIVLRFSELLGGKVDVTSEADKGSTFEVILPRGDISSVTSSSEDMQDPVQDYDGLPSEEHNMFV